jgi:hypothetical protein
MVPAINLPQYLNLLYIGYNRGLPENSPSDFQPIKNPDGSIQETFCNQFFQFVCSGMGYNAFNGMMANDIIKFMLNPQNGWISPADEATVQSHANAGVISVAGWINPNGHGHVCFVLPGVLEKSQLWGKLVPSVANVGETVFFGRHISFAFGIDKQPQYFCLSGQIS